MFDIEPTLPYWADGFSELKEWIPALYDPYTLLYGDLSHQAMDQTNWDYILNELGDVPYLHNRSTEEDILSAIDKGIAVIGNILWVRDQSTLQEFQEALEVYPLLDEDAYYRLEQEEWSEFAPVALEDEIRDWKRLYAMDLSEDVEEFLESEEVLEYVNQQLHYCDGFSGDYGPSMLSIIGEFIRRVWKMQVRRCWP